MTTTQTTEGTMTTATNPAIGEAIAQELNTWLPEYGRVLDAVARLIARTGDARWLDERHDLLLDAAGILPSDEVMADADDPRNITEEQMDVALGGLRAIADGAWDNNDAGDDDYPRDRYEATSYGVTCYASDSLAPRGLTMRDLCDAFGGDVVAASRAIVAGQASLYGMGA